jgi:hypothetical protein
LRRNRATAAGTFALAAAIIGNAILAGFPSPIQAGSPAAISTSAPPATYTAFAWIAPAKPLGHVVGVVRFQAKSDPEQVARDLMARPAGARALLRWESNDNHLWHNRHDQLALPQTGMSRLATGQGYQGPWIANGAAAEAAFESRFADALKQRRAMPDLLVLDLEMGVGTWDMTPPQLAAIVADSRWPALAKRFGLRSTSELIGVLDTPDARAFNLAMQVTEGGYFRDAFFIPWQGRFPMIHCSDFGDGVLDDKQEIEAPDDNGVIQPMSLPMHGDLQSPCCYAWVHRIGHVPANQGADFNKPLPVLCWLSSMVRAYARSPQPVLPWIAAKSWTDATSANPRGSVGIRDTAFQDELVWHICLSAGCTDVLFFNPDARPADDAAVDGDLAELQRESGDATSLRPIEKDAVPYASGVLVSGAVTPGGRRLYRVTVGTIEATARQVSVGLDGNEGISTVEIPPGACGAWLLR